MVQVENISDLRDVGFVYALMSEEMRARVEDTFAYWYKFCDLPEEEKVRLTVGDRSSDHGYYLRNDKDRKELFDVNLGQIPELLDLAHGVSGVSALDFVCKVKELLEAIAPLVIEFARATEWRFGIRGLEERTRCSMPQWYYRGLHYFPRDEEIIANSHPDLSGFTFQLTESHQGLEYLTYRTRQWRPVPVVKNRVVAFAGLKLQHMDGGEQLHALCHRVRSSAVARRQHRYSSVAFIHPRYSHTWSAENPSTRDLPEAFNYSEDLAKYFVPTGDR